MRFHSVASSTDRSATPSTMRSFRFNESNRSQALLFFLIPCPILSLGKNQLLFA